MLIGIFKYRMRAIITRGFHTFYLLIEDQKRFSRGFFLEILALCMISIQERVMMARVRYTTDLQRPVSFFGRVS